MNAKTEKTESAVPTENYFWPHDQMLEWCEAENARGYASELARWYYVNRIKLPNGEIRHEIAVIEGEDAVSIRRIANGTFRPFGPMSDEATEAYKSKMRHHMRNGMSQARYFDLTQRPML